MFPIQLIYISLGFVYISWQYTTYDINIISESLITFKAFLLCTQAFQRSYFFLLFLLFPTF